MHFISPRRVCSPSSCRAAAGAGNVVLSSTRSTSSCSREAPAPVLHPDEVNFWQPSGSHPARHILRSGTPFLFKLRRSNWIAGGGVFVRFTTLPASVAWAAFGDKNGAVTQSELLDRLARLKPSFAC